MGVTDRAVLVDKVLGWPVLVLEGAPGLVVVVLRYRVLQVVVVPCHDDVLRQLLELELRRVYAQDHEPLVGILVVPLLYIGECPDAVDARIGPEVDQHDLPPLVLHRERLGVEPAFQPSQLGRHALGARGAGQEARDLLGGLRCSGGLRRLRRLRRRFRHRGRCCRWRSRRHDGGCRFRVLARAAGKRQQRKGGDQRNDKETSSHVVSLGPAIKSGGHTRSPSHHGASYRAGSFVPTKAIVTTLPAVCGWEVDRPPIGPSQRIRCAHAEQSCEQPSYGRE